MAVRVLDTLETERLILRPRRVSEALIYHQLWTERDPRVPPRRRIRPRRSDRPCRDIAAQMLVELEEPGLGAVSG